ncbi:MAG: lytic transglycosylase domain-containing protein [Defluviitaleaceae bacterium]|nr:lytic transglycosylase domain-containing protein [Defluviitaleaceae bacterium]MCL2262107.1 lytic transglycosylase domain-containing protein [Defluviitaleaceae bacterium]
MKKRITIATIFFLTLIAAGMIFNMRFPVRHLDIVRENAGDLDVPLILAVIKAESSFRENAHSHAGAQGLMQLMPATAADVAAHMGLVDFQPQDVWLPEVNIAMGSFYLNRLVNMYGCVQLALAAYNAGQGRVNRWLADPEISRDGKTLDNIPFPETYNYLRRVNRNRRIYSIILAVTGRA